MINYKQQTHKFTREITILNLFTRAGINSALLKKKFLGNFREEKLRNEKQHCALALLLVCFQLFRRLLSPLSSHLLCCRSKKSPSRLLLITQNKLPAQTHRVSSMKVATAPDRLINLQIRAIKIMFYGNQLCYLQLHYAFIGATWSQEFINNYRSWPVGPWRFAWISCTIIRDDLGVLLCEIKMQLVIIKSRWNALSYCLIRPNESNST